MRPALLVLLIAAAAHPEWSVHSRRGRLRACLERVKRGELRAEDAEVWKRLRDARLRPLLRRAAQAEGDWRTRHRALFALARIGDAADLDVALALLSHPQRRLRERAALTALALWRPDAVLPETAERDPHVRSCLQALRRRAAGRLLPARAAERTEEGPGGYRHVAWRETPPEGPAETLEETGAAPPVAERWVAPLLGWDEEVVDEAPLEGFGLADGGRVHAGVDRGACLDGAGVYAPAAGIVRLVTRGGESGTLVVIEHQLRPGERVCSVLAGLSGALFVSPGESVAAGQLVGTIGMGYSDENGGRFAHLHLGIFAAPFEPRAGREWIAASEPLGLWLDPRDALALWMGWTQPLVGDLRPVHASLRGVRSDALRGRLGRAYAAALRARDRAEPGSEPHVDATYIAGELARAPERALARARALRDGGYPRDALDELKRWALALKSIPGAEALQETRKRWQSDPLFKKALEGEGKLRRTDPGDRAAWQALLDEYGGTCLAARIRPRLR